MAIAVSTSAAIRVNPQVALAARAGLTSIPKQLPPWLFYDEAGSRLFDQITELPEYYLTRTERSILTEYAGEMIAHAADGARLQITELGAGSADKTRVLLQAAVEQQGGVLYEPVDVSSTALLVAQARIEREIPGVRVMPYASDYTNGFFLDRTNAGERRLVLYIGSSIGNFEPNDARRVLHKVRKQLVPGDCLLLGVDLVKDEAVLLAAYDDAAGTTAAFNKNVLHRLNRDLAADFDLAAFAHRAAWNPALSRIEMHLVSRRPQQVQISALDLAIEFGVGESIHTENSYKYRPDEAETLLAATDFAPIGSWTDERGWFAVHLARAE
ncbi:MAG TPA: L-histidine N(alpha)-methyltransferase [Terracidiphilus sp.]|jgi:L-histidine Nalpha-methyltransferase|nr:L-histidine N(alpha)-methyltransferase [Terracidiphilus sp.]